jgi:Spy/CpxP family protein refolding chaperone
MEKKVLGVALLSMALAASSALAQGPGAPGRGGARYQRLADYLGLSEEQQASWKSLWQQHQTEMAPLRQEGRGLRESLKAAMAAENPDPSTVGAAALALKQHRDKVMAAREAFTGRLSALLTPEQKTRFEAFRALRKSGPGFGGGFGRHGHSADVRPPVQG